MPVDQDFANRIREQLADVDGITEKAMFGGLGFLLHGNMAVGIMSTGDLMVRVGADGTEDALAKPHTRLFEMRGMQVDPAFAEWLERNLTLGTRGVPTFQIGGEPILITAVKADAIARTLAEDLAHCEATSH